MTFNLCKGGRLLREGGRSGGCITNCPYLQSEPARKVSSVKAMIRVVETL